MTRDPFNVNDHLVQAGRPPRKEGRHVNMPMELGSTMVFDTLSAFEAARDARYQSGTMYYGRYGNAAVYQLETVLAGLERADGVTLTSSGVAAVTMALMALTKPGDHVLVADHAYGNTRTFCDGLLTRQGVSVEYYDPMIGAGLSDLIRETTTVVMLESPGSGTFEVPDIPAIAKAASDRGVISVIDNTWASPLLCQPLELGVDVVVYSGSKYLCGHSDCMLGVIAARGAHVARIRKTVMSIGDKPGSQEVFLALRSLRTLKLRMQHVETAALDMAQWLARQPQVKAVLHPAFPGCPGHEFWKRDYSGAAGLFGVIFHPCADDQVRTFVDALHHFSIGVSWGGFESLVLPVNPVRSATQWNEPGQLVRFNIGFEDLQSLKDDLSAALPHLNTAQETPFAQQD